jgi:hypothetical protein
MTYLCGVLINQKNIFTMVIEFVICVAMTANAQFEQQISVVTPVTEVCPPRWGRNRDRALKGRATKWRGISPKRHFNRRGSGCHVRRPNPTPAAMRF